MKQYIESNQGLRDVAGILARYNSPHLKSKLQAQIKIAKAYLLLARNDGLPNQNSWDCGRQDAYGDKVDDMFRELDLLKGAYELTLGRMDRLKAAYLKTTGEDQ